MKRTTAPVVLATALMLVGLSVNAYATETVIIENMEITCPNSCVVTQNGSQISVRDSGGERLIIRFLKPVDR
jgi:hypothetical protein